MHFTHIHFFLLFRNVFVFVYKSFDRVAEQLDTFTHITHFLHIRAVTTGNIAHSYFFCLTFKHKFIFEL